jgi:hypothetical protein
MGYWVYENWTAESKAVVHSGDCGYCHDGNGCHEHKLGERNGKWHGPFGTVEQAMEAARKTGRPSKPCRCVK